jgi:hypothetical protein
MTAAVAAFRHVAFPHTPHDPHSTKGEANRQIEGGTFPRTGDAGTIVYSDRVPRVAVIGPHNR